MGYSVSLLDYIVLKFDFKNLLFESKSVCIREGGEFRTALILAIFFLALGLFKIDILFDLDEGMVFNSDL